MTALLMPRTHAEEHTPYHGGGGRRHYGGNDQQTGDGCVPETNAGQDEGNTEPQQQWQNDRWEDNHAGMEPRAPEPLIVQHQFLTHGRHTR